MNDNLIMSPLGTLMLGQQPLKSATQFARQCLRVRDLSVAFAGPIPYHVDDFARRLRDRDPPLFAQIRNQPEVNYVQTALEMHASVRWMDQGLPIFELSEDLLAGLVLTDPSNLITTDVRMPFPTFVVQLPSGFWWTSNNRGERSSGVLVMCHRYSTIDRKTEIKKTGILLHLLTTDGTGLWDRAYWPDIPERLDQSWLQVVAHNRTLIGEIEQSDLQLQLQLRKLLANLCVHIAEHGRGRRRDATGKTRRKQRKRKPKRAAKLDKPLVPVWTLGHGVKLGRELIDAARADVGALRDRWQVTKRFCVRGHYRNQAHGPGRKLRKLIWIEPFWKGPRTGERLAHLYSDMDSDNKK